MGTHFFTVSQNNVVAVSFQSIRISAYLSIPIHEVLPMLKEGILKLILKT